jgi:hypothetical protein
MRHCALPLREVRKGHTVFGIRLAALHEAGLAKF